MNKLERFLEVVVKLELNMNLPPDDLRKAAALLEMRANEKEVLRGLIKGHADAVSAMLERLGARN